MRVLSRIILTNLFLFFMDLQVVLSQMTDNLTSLVGESADLPPPLPPGFTLKPGESKGGGMPILRLYFESLQVCCIKLHTLLLCPHLSRHAILD